jgi:Acetyltransferase (GNAT) domain
MLRRTVISLQSEKSVPDWWDPLFLVAARSSVFVSKAWLESWLKIYGGDFEGWWIRWDYDGEVVGGCMVSMRVATEGKVPLRSLALNATGQASERTPFAEYNDVLWVEPYRHEIAADLCTFLQSQTWDRLQLSGYENDGVLAELARNITVAKTESRIETSAYVDLASVRENSLEFTLSANARNQLRRSAAGYEAQFGPLQLVSAASVTEALEFLTELAKWHNLRRRAKGEAGSFESSSVMSFHRYLIERLFDESRVELLRLDAGITTIGYLYNFVHDGKVYFFQSGFRYDGDAKMKPGLLMHARAISQSAANGRREYDFLAGEARYKKSLAKCARTLHWTVLFRNVARVRALLKLRTVIRGLRGSRDFLVRKCMRAGTPQHFELKLLRAAIWFVLTALAMGVALLADI